MQLVKIEWSKHEWRGCMKHDQHLHNQWYILFFAYNEFKLDDWTKPVKKKWYEFQFDGNWHSLFNDWKEIINSCVKVRNIFSFFLLVLSEDQVSLDINYIILENTC